jgi:hypothetical protein
MRANLISCFGGEVLTGSERQIVGEGRLVPQVPSDDWIVEVGLSGEIGGTRIKGGAS